MGEEDITLVLQRENKTMTNGKMNCLNFKQPGE